MLTVDYPFDPCGNTVPYPPLFDGISRNHGFVDLRGRPEQVRQIPETGNSAALESLLTRLADPQSAVISVGCDLGEHLDTRARLNRRRVAGGYIQILRADYRDQDREALIALAKGVETSLRAEVANQTWTVRFELQPVHINLGEPVQTYTIWLWFMAADSSLTKARISRERLLKAVERGLTFAGTS